MEDKTNQHTKDGERGSEICADDLKYVSGKQLLKGGALGVCIGLAIIIPGVSGSAVAIIMKLYEKLLFALGNLFRSFRRCALFLLPIAAGMAVGLILGFFGVLYLLNFMFFAVVALFAGLMCGAFPAITDELKGESPSPPRITLFAAGVAVPVAVSVIAIFAGGGGLDLQNIEIWHYFIYLVLGFVIAITQLVPGLSATALLMTAGSYEQLINSVSVSFWQSDPEVFAVYACLIAGFVAGLLTLSKLLTVLLKRFRAAVFYTVAGLSLGSVVTMFFNPEIYNEYCLWADGATFWPDLIAGAALFIAGFAAAYLLVRAQRKRSLHPEKQKNTRP